MFICLDIQSSKWFKMWKLFANLNIVTRTSLDYFWYSYLKNFATSNFCMTWNVKMLDMLYLKVVDTASLVWFQNVQWFEVSSLKIVQECSRKNVHLSWHTVVEMIQNVKTFCQFEHCYANIPRLFLVQLFEKLCYK